jgi:glutamate racemase
MKDKRGQSVGVFDSGIGGLTVARELMRQLPGERLVYLGDTARTPYGNKSPENLVRFALETGGFLAKQGVKLLVVACNTSSAYSLPALRKKLKIPVVGVILAGARAAVDRRAGQNIGVIGTHATVRSGAYQKAIRGLEPSAKVLAQACPLFVPLVEEGWASDPVASQVALRYLGPLKKQGVDTVVLGCTHYPLLKPVLRKILGPKIALVDSARETAYEVAELLQAMGMASTRKKVPFSGHRFYVTDLPEQFSALGTRFLGQPLKQVHTVSLAQLAKASA